MDRTCAQDPGFDSQQSEGKAGGKGMRREKKREGEERREQRSSKWYVETVSSRQLNTDVWVSHSSEPLTHCVRLLM